MDTPPVIINAYPSAKEQLIAGAIAIGLTAATAVVIFGGAALAGKIAEKINEKKNKKVDPVPETVVDPAA